MCFITFTLLLHYLLLHAFCFFFIFVGKLKGAFIVFMRNANIFLNDIPNKYLLYINFLTFEEFLTERGRQPHFFSIFSRYSLVKQLSKDSSFWHAMTSRLSALKDFVTFISFNMFKLYWPSPWRTTGSKKRDEVF